MAAATHDIDPDGDIILKLTDANAPFAVWPEKDATDADGKEHETFTDNLDGIDANSEAGEDPEQQGDATKPSTNSVSSSADENVNTPERPVVPAPEVHLRLSSKHLTLVSPYFKSMLCGPWKEGDRSGTQTRVLTAESWDQDALLTVMCIIHGRNKKVPREVDIEMMAKIAVIVDYYQCHEALEVFSDIWLKELKRTVLLPEAYNRDAVLWLHIANVFSDDLTVRSMTRIMQRDLTEPLSTLGLPIPASVVDRLEAFRTQSIGRLIDEIHVHFTSLSQSFPRTCTDRCDLMSLGAITREMATNNLLLRPKLPYRGKSVGQLMTIMEALRKPSWCPSTHLSRKSKYRYESDFWSDLHSTGKSEGGACQQAEKSWPALQEVMAGIVGFGL